MDSKQRKREIIMKADLARQRIALNLSLMRYLARSLQDVLRVSDPADSVAQVCTGVAARSQLEDLEKSCEGLRLTLDGLKRDVGAYFEAEIEPVD